MVNTYVLQYLSVSAQPEMRTVIYEYLECRATAYDVTIYVASKTAPIHCRRRQMSSWAVADNNKWADVVRFRVYGLAILEAGHDSYDIPVYGVRFFENEDGER